MRNCGKYNSNGKFKKLSYLGNTYNFFEILRILGKIQISGTTIKSSINPGIVTAYDGAIDQMAMFMNAFCHDISSYSSGGQTYAYSSAAYEKIENLGFDVTDFESFDLEEIENLLQENQLIFIDGAGFPHGTGHAFVADGLASVKYDGYEEKYLHLDMGWNGNGNGYYLGPIFYVDYVQSRYRGAAYFGVRKEY